jgi:hypothetical protein
MLTKNQLMFFLEKWKNILGLSNWRIIVVYENCEDSSSYMEIERSSNYQRAKLIVPHWFVGEGEIPSNILMKPELVDKSFYEEIIIHELLHLIVTPMSVIIRDDLDGYLHRDVFGQIQKSFTHAEERVVDNLAVALRKAFQTKQEENATLL